MSKPKSYLSAILVCFLPLALFGQASVTGTVTDARTGGALAGANVIVEGTDLGAAADASGRYTIGNVPAGTQTITASVIGYDDASQSVNVPPAGSVTVNFALRTAIIQLSALEVLASRATRNTPVAFSNVEKTEMEARLGSQDIPLILNTTPSVYATMQGGGAGDARVNVRGFNQRNVAIMINGVPVNDMENGWVYWSNWDGVADATSSIQMQRGLSAVNLATPSIGGTMNILTDPTTHTRGGRFKQELASGKFLKTTINYNTGMIGDKLALGGTLVRKTGDGIIDKTWTDAWAYYLGASYALNKSHRFELFALGAPQRHGQMRYKQNVAAYDHDFAKDLDGYDEEALDTYVEANADSLYGESDDDAKAGRYWNENWNVISSSYKGKEYYYMYGAKTAERHAPGFLNESENYFHKPQVNLNWFWTLNDQTRLSSIFYFSGGSGGGTGTFGDILWDYSGPSRIGDWDGTIAINQGTENRRGNAKPAGESVGYLRNSINRQWTLGAISKLNYDVNEELKLQFGVDWRTAEIEHAREVRSLLGGEYAVNGSYNNRADIDQRYSYFYNEFDEVYVNGELDYDATLANASNKKLGDIINYHNTNTVDWIGFFAQAEYAVSAFALYGMAGFSQIKYTFTDFFKKAENYPGYGETDKGELFIESDWISAIQFKGGGLYHVSDQLDVFANFGVVGKPPILDNVIDDVNASLSTDPANEQFISTEGGMNYRGWKGMMNAKLNLYNTVWKDRSATKLVNTGAGSSTDTDIIFLTGLDQTHRGVEVEAAYQPMSMLRLNGALSYGLWEFTDDAEGSYRNFEAGTSEDYTYSVRGLKVGDMPQTIVAAGATVFPMPGLSLMAVLNWYDRHWADWDPLSREVEEGVEPDRKESWEVPGYSKIDLHGSYNIPIPLAGVRLQAFFHVFNLLDEIYIQDATDNSPYNGFDDDHDADDAEVYLGTPRNVNVGLNVNF